MASVDAVAGAGFDVDGVVADAEAGDHAELGRALEVLLVDDISTGDDRLRLVELLLVVALDVDDVREWTELIRDVLGEV